MNTRNKILAVILVLAIAVMGVAVYEDVRADGNFDIFDNLIIHGTTRHQGAVTMDGALTVTGASTLTGVATFTGAPVFSGGVAAVDSAAGVELTTFFDVDAATSITVTNGAAFTPTGTYQPITAAGSVTPTITANSDAGTFLVLVNTSNTSILIADTSRNAGDVTLGQYDSVTYISDGTGWVELSRSNN